MKQNNSSIKYGGGYKNKESTINSGNNRPSSAMKKPLYRP